MNKPSSCITISSCYSKLNISLAAEAVERTLAVGVGLPSPPPRRLAPAPRQGRRAEHRAGLLQLWDVLAVL